VALVKAIDIKTPTEPKKRRHSRMPLSGIEETTFSWIPDNGILE